MNLREEFAIRQSIKWNLFPREHSFVGSSFKIFQTVVFNMEHFRTGFVVFGLVLCMILKSGSQEIRVDGDDFVAYNLSSMPWLSRIKKHSLMLDFKTVHPSGLLVYIGSEMEQADFLMLDLVRGKLRYEVSFTVEL